MGRVNLPSSVYIKIVFCVISNDTLIYIGNNPLRRNSFI